VTPKYAYPSETGDSPASPDELAGSSEAVGASLDGVFSPVTPVLPGGDFQPTTPGPIPPPPNDRYSRHGSGRHRARRGGVLRLIGLITILLGLAALAIGLWQAYQAFGGDPKQVTAVVTNSSSDQTELTYDVKGQTYKAVLARADSSYHVGQEVEILYSSADPTQAELRSSAVLKIAVLGGLGLVLLVLGLSLHSVGRRRRRRAHAREKAR